MFIKENVFMSTLSVLHVFQYFHKGQYSSNWCKLLILLSVFTVVMVDKQFGEYLITKQIKVNVYGNVTKY